ncbi:hypothetical protein [Actinomycetospora termitidis]|uniref:Uncharacterized protein n=1 Tax=Actinomycetospora termitidis TaxID=3053470 RepID=A0ABT7MFJ0_9PSEU|nr:hypothetical protein [Actinomycetospora sp. Odt1-22]MDL5159435.1 hypothetical protein [Actinomycetospora sp. Odt1-22]
MSVVLFSWLMISSVGLSILLLIYAGAVQVKAERTLRKVDRDSRL